jgi:hypothetical protein
LRPSLTKTTDKTINYPPDTSWTAVAHTGVHAVNYLNGFIKDYGELKETPVGMNPKIRIPEEGMCYAQALEKRHW